MKTVVAAVLVALFASPVLADDAKEAERLRNATTVLREILGMPESIPKDLLDRAECVIVFPSVKKFAVGIGGSYGRGAIVCPSGKVTPARVYQVLEAAREDWTRHGGMNDVRALAHVTLSSSLYQSFS